MELFPNRLDVRAGHINHWCLAVRYHGLSHYLLNCLLRFPIVNKTQFQFYLLATYRSFMAQDAAAASGCSQECRGAASIGRVWDSETPKVSVARHRSSLLTIWRVVFQVSVAHVLALLCSIWRRSLIGLNNRFSIIRISRQFRQIVTFMSSVCTTESIVLQHDYTCLMAQYSILPTFAWLLKTLTWQSVLLRKATDIRYVTRPI